LGSDVASALGRIGRLGFGVLKPLLLSALAKTPSNEDLLSLLKQSERFLFLVRSLVKTRSEVAGPDSYRLSHELYNGSASVIDAAELLESRVSRHFNTPAFQNAIDELYADEKKGFYSLATLKFLLFEVEEHLRRHAKASDSKISWEDFRGARKSVEHVYPQEATDDAWPAFKGFSEKQKHLLRHSLGNLVAVSIAKNASLSRSKFDMKKAGTDNIPGFSQGSFSELRIAQSRDWEPLQIVKRGLEILEFVEERWRVELGDLDTKKRLLKLEFMTNEGDVQRQLDFPAGNN
jgi:Protein of unknown function (DUF1524)